MTIAAGLIYDAGILLCADSEITLDISKLRGNKLGYLKCEHGTLAGALAGNVDYATAAFELAMESIADGSCCSLQDLRRLLRTEYRKNVFQHPLYSASPETFKYSLVLAVKFAGDRRATLHATNEAILRPVRTYRCEGMGRELGNSIFSLLCKERPDLMTERFATALASYMLARVKYGVTGCGGQSSFIIVGHDGKPAETQREITEHIEKNWGWFGRVKGRVKFRV